MNGDESETNKAAILLALKVNQTEALASDGAVTNLTTGHTTTNDAGNYNWTGTITADTDAAAALNNYTLASTASSATGTSIVNKAKLTGVTLSDIERTYGNDTITSGGYSATAFEGLVNGDTLDSVKDSVTITETADGAVDGRARGTFTNNTGNYTWSGNVTEKTGADGKGLLTNYILGDDGSLTNSANSKVNKASMTVTLNDVQRTYGSATQTDGKTYGIKSIATNNTNGDDLSDLKNLLTMSSISDGALSTESGKTTNDANHEDDAQRYYSWTANVSGDTSTDGAKLNNNYTLTINAGNSEVTTAPLSAVLSNVKRKYGSKDVLTDNTKYDISHVEGATNGDTLDAIKAALSEIDAATIDDGALTGNPEGKVTKDVGTYSWTAHVSADHMHPILRNYDFDTKAQGTSIVEKATLNVELSEVARYEGSTDLVNNTSYKVESMSDAKNGDNFSNATLTHIKDGALTADGKGTNGVGSYDWTAELSGDDAVAKILSNYEIVMGKGVSTVLERPISDEDTEQTRYFFRDAPWDRNEDARERKAQLHFIAGGMRL